MPEMDKMFSKMNKKHKLPKPTKKQRNNYLKICQKTYCNKNCKGYTLYGVKLKQKNGFTESYSKDRIEMLQKRGALSGCVDVLDYNVYHK